MKMQSLAKVFVLGLASCLFMSSMYNSCNPGPCMPRCRPCPPDRQCTPDQTPPCAPCTEGKHHRHFVGNSGNCSEYDRSCYMDTQCQPCKPKKPKCVKPPKPKCCPTPKPKCCPTPKPKCCPTPAPKCAPKCAPVNNGNNGNNMNNTNNM
ncbi:MAG: hypothetical protein JHC93_01350 [Parachlamydiales bacterium]|nr:hypothetical protein [Parachlamydiales bacterium]